MGCGADPPPARSRGSTHLLAGRQTTAEMTRRCVGGLHTIPDAVTAVCASDDNGEARAAATPQFDCAYLFAVVRSKK